MTDGRFAGLAREALITTTPAAQFDGLIREVLLAAPTAAYFDNVVREVLAQFPSALTLNLAATEAPDTATFSVSVFNHWYLALAATEPADHASFSLTVVPFPIDTLTLAATEAPDRMTSSILAVTPENSLRQHSLGALSRPALQPPAPRVGPRRR